ncbi:pyridoxal phosphate-dependent aminotransferase [Kiloniella sp.]|uniref:pyridoxal phosphate-dependent aminotransferase n=1 Tax=Kiloniella sp. TaxID=1938587 RepID=UPI003B01B5ED
MITAVPHVEAMAAYALADLGGDKMISLAQNESAFPASPTALEVGRTVMDNMSLYPDPEWLTLRRAISEVHALDTAKILCGSGSMELIGCLIRAFVGSGDQVLGTEFGYAYVASATAQVRAKYVKAPEFDFTVSVDSILGAVTPETKIVFVCNPGNPTGTLIDNTELIRLRDSLPDNILLVIDQAYAEFSDDIVGNDPNVIFDLVNRGDTVVLRTFSKAYGLAGARVGWGYFPTHIAGEVRKLLNPNNISTVSQEVAAAAMRDQAHMKEIVRKTAAIRDDFSHKVRGLRFEIPESRTNFILIRFADTEEAQQADQALRDNSLLMRGMSGYGLSNCLRATICEEAVMKRAFTVLEGVRNDV